MAWWGARRRPPSPSSATLVREQCARGSDERCTSGTDSLTLMFVLLAWDAGPDNGGAAPGEPKTTSAEWAAATVEYGKAQKANPITHFKG